MDPHLELKILEELQEYVKPMFGLFLESTFYSKEKEEIKFTFEDTGDGFTKQVSTPDKKPYYAKLLRENESRYFSRMISNINHKGEILFGVEDVENYLKHNPGLPVFLVEGRYDL